jgi:hypothetical protein
MDAGTRKQEGGEGMSNILHCCLYPRCWESIDIDEQFCERHKKIVFKAKDSIQAILNCVNDDEVDLPKPDKKEAG